MNIQTQKSGIFHQKAASIHQARKMSEVIRLEVDDSLWPDLGRRRDLIDRQLFFLSRLLKPSADCLHHPKKFDRLNEVLAPEEMAAVHAGLTGQSIEINQDLSWFSSFARPKCACVPECQPSRIYRARSLGAQG